MRTINYYSKFSENVVFDNPTLNVFCNQMFMTLINRLDEDTVTKKLILDGSVALHLQDEPVTELSKIKFSTNSILIFDTLKNTISSLSANSITLDYNRVVLKFADFYFEIRMVQKELKPVNKSGIWVNNKVDILNEI